DLQVDIPQPLLDAAYSPFSARALIYSLLLDPQPALRQTQLAQLQSGAAPVDFTETMRLAEPVRQLSEAVRLPLVDATLPALRQLSPGQDQAFRAQVDGLIHADNQVSLFEYTLHCMLTHSLDVAFGLDKPKVRYTRKGQVASQVAVVLSHLAWDEQEN